MKTVSKKSVKQGRRRSRKEIGTTAGCAIFLMTGGGAALAQDQSAESLEEVVVSGIRKSIEDSVGVKKEENSIVEVISAEDIGKLPDASIAESIGRLPGVAAQRAQGRAQTLSIRGLGPDFTVTTFNGREQASTNDNRTVEFDQYPSELVTQVKIYKTPNAGLAYQGIAGTTDIATVHPLALDSRKIAVSYKREQNDMEANIPGLDDAGNRASGTYIDQFMDGTLGVAFGVAYNKTPYQAQTREPWGYAPLSGGETVIGGDKDGVQSSFYERTGFMGVVEFKPNDKLHMLLDAYHSDFQELQTIQRMEYGTAWTGGPVLTNPGPIENNRVQSGTWTDVPFVVIENYNNDRHADLDSIGLNTKFAFNDNWGMDLDLSWSHVNRDDLRLESTAGMGKVGDPTFVHPEETISFTTEKNGITLLNPTLNYSSYDDVFLTDPGSWGGGPRRSGFVGHPEIEDEIQAVRLSVTRKFDNFLSDVTLGVNYAEREKTKTPFQSNLYLPGAGPYAVVPEAYRTGTANTDFFGSSTGMISYDAIGLYNSGFWQPIDSIDDPTANMNDRVYDVTNKWDVTEKLTTAYLMLGFDSDLDGLPLRGNVGVQAVHTDQSADIGYTSGLKPNSTDLNVSVVTQGDTYTDVLPSLNLSIEFPHETKLRFAAADTQARPRMDDLGGGAGYSAVPNSGTPIVVDGQSYYWSRSGGGNPELHSWRAKALDLSLEKYFGNKGYLSAALYYKDITSYIFNSSVLTSFEGVLLPDQTSPTDPTQYTFADQNRTGVATVKANGNGGYIKGVELTASLPFGSFTPVLEGFGMILSASKNESEITINGEKTSIPGMSTKVFNSTLYYERNGFSARVSNRYRDDFVGEVQNFDATLTLRTVNAESLLDAQIGYEFYQGAMKGLSISLSGTNLTDEPFVLSNQGDTAYNLVKYENYGASYALALGYKF